jgi:hypothetical protein
VYGGPWEKLITVINQFTGDLKNKGKERGNVLDLCRIYIFV